MTDTYLVESLGANAAAAEPKLGGQILSESADEWQTPQNVDLDDPSFKAYTIRWMAVAAQLVPSVHDTIMTIIKASAQGAAGQCIGTSPTQAQAWTVGPYDGKNWCGRRWYQTTWDGHNELGAQMSAMSIFANSLLDSSAPPLTANNGGNSKSDPTAGTGSAQSPLPLIYTRSISAGDRIGAAILSVVNFAVATFAVYFMASGD